MAEVEVSQLTIYPLKSASGIQVPQVELDHFGFKGDRRWMLVDLQGRFLSQRRLPRMCLLQAHEFDDELRVSAPGMSNIVVKKPDGQLQIKVEIWADQCVVHDAGDEAAQWFEQFLDTPCRLVYFPESVQRQIDTQYAQLGERTAFSDGFPILLISEASLQALNERLVQPVGMERFRPNLVVKGCEPFAEDGWQKLRYGDLILRIVKPCSRCIIPNIDQTTGQRFTEPAKTLATFRRQGNQIYFGQNAINEGVGQLVLGGKLEIVS